MLKPITTFLMAMSFCFAFGQTVHTTEHTVFDSDVKPQDWVLYYTDGQTIKIEYKFFECDYTSGYDQEHVFLRMTNLTGADMAANWHAQLDYAGQCATCDKVNEYTYGLNFSANQVIEGTCDRSTGHAVRIFSGFNDINYTKGKQLTGFKLDNLTVITLQ